MLIDTYMTPCDLSLDWDNPGGGLLIVDTIWAPYCRYEDAKRPVMPYFLCSESSCYKDTSRLLDTGIYGSAKIR